MRRVIASFISAALFIMAPGPQAYLAFAMPMENVRAGTARPGVNPVAANSLSPKQTLSPISSSLAAPSINSPSPATTDLLQAPAQPIGPDNTNRVLPNASVHGALDNFLSPAHQENGISIGRSGNGHPGQSDRSPSQNLLTLSTLSPDELQAQLPQIFDRQRPLEDSSPERSSESNRAAGLNHEPNLLHTPESDASMRATLRMDERIRRFIPRATLPSVWERFSQRIYRVLRDINKNWSRTREQKLEGIVYLLNQTRTGLQPIKEPQILTMLEDLHKLYGQFKTEFGRTRIVDNIGSVLNLVSETGLPFYPLQARKQAAFILEDIIRRHDVKQAGDEKFLARKHLKEYFGPQVKPYRIENIWSHLPLFIHFPTLLSLREEVLSNREIKDGLQTLSPSASIAVIARAYAALRRGEYPRTVAARAKASIAAFHAREDRLRDWKPTIGIEVEILSRTVPDYNPHGSRDVEYSWGRAAELLADIFGVRTAYDELIEYCPGPGFDWRTEAEMIDALIEAGLIPQVDDDYAKLHVTLVHSDPYNLGSSLDVWRENGRIFALIEGILAVDERRLQEATYHLTSMRNEDFKNDDFMINISGIPSNEDHQRAEYLAGSVGPQRSPSGEFLHHRALRILDTLQTGFYAEIMDEADPASSDLPQRYWRRYWAKDAKAKRKLAALYGRFIQEVMPVLERHHSMGADHLSAMAILDLMDPDNYDRQEDFLELRANRAFVAELDEVVERNVAKMDALIQKIAEGKDKNSDGEDGASAHKQAPRLAVSR